MTYLRFEKDEFAKKDDFDDYGCCENYFKWENFPCILIS